MIGRAIVRHPGLEQGERLLALVELHERVEPLQRQLLGLAAVGTDERGVVLAEQGLGLGGPRRRGVAGPDRPPHRHRVAVFASAHRGLGQPPARLGGVAVAGTGPHAGVRLIALKRGMERFPAAVEIAEQDPRLAQQQRHPAGRGSVGEVFDAVEGGDRVGVGPGTQGGLSPHDGVVGGGQGVGGRAAGGSRARGEQGQLEQLEVQRVQEPQEQWQQQHHG